MSKLTEPVRREGRDATQDCPTPKPYSIGLPGQEGTQQPCTLTRGSQSSHRCQGRRSSTGGSSS